MPCARALWGAMADRHGPLPMKISMMHTNPTDSSAHVDRSLEHRVRRRYEHGCGQLIWVIEAPQGPLYFSELLPTLPPPITDCPRCGAPVTRENLIRPQRHPGSADRA